MPTGFGLLDAVLPGAGWPLGSMVEILQEQPHQHAWQLLLPALAQAARQQAGPVVLVGAPFQPFGVSLAAQGLPAERLLWVRTDQPAARLWAAEQALRCADVIALLHGCRRHAARSCGACTWRPSSTASCCSCFAG